MKKRLALCILLFGLSTLALYGELKSYIGGGSNAYYEGTTRENTLDNVYNHAWKIIASNEKCSNMYEFSGKLSKEQTRLLWLGLKQYDYAPGEFYIVEFAEENNRHYHFLCVCKVKSDYGLSMRAFTFLIE